MSRVLVALDRAEAGRIWESSVHGGLLVEEETSDALRAALDTDRRHLVCLLAAMVFEFATGREWPDASDSEIRECDEFAGRVLALLENGGQEA